MKYGGRAESEAGDGARTRRHRGVVTLQRGGTDVREEEEADEQVHVRGGEGIKSPDECMR